MSPLEFIQRLAALVPRPRLHLIRFHGVLASNARLRPDIIPSVPVNANTPQADHELPPPAAPAPMSWARLLKRVFEIDMEHCPQCGGTLTIIAAIEHSPVIANIIVSKTIREGVARDEDYRAAMASASGGDPPGSTRARDRPHSGAASGFRRLSCPEYSARKSA